MGAKLVTTPDGDPFAFFQLQSHIIALLADQPPSDRFDAIIAWHF